VNQRPAKLPDELFHAPPRKLKELAVGETARVQFEALKVDPEQNCFIDTSEEVKSRRTGGTIEITRAMDGFHACVPANMRYRGNDIPASLKKQLVPLISVTIGRPEAI
jgi:hypothetical protein